MSTSQLENCVYCGQVAEYTAFPGYHNVYICGYGCRPFILSDIGRRGNVAEYTYKPAQITADMLLTHAKQLEDGYTKVRLQSFVDVGQAYYILIMTTPGGYSGKWNNPLPAGKVWDKITAAIKEGESIG